MVLTPVLSNHTFKFIDVPSALITTGTTSAIILHGFLNSRARSCYFLDIFSFFLVHSLTLWNSKISNLIIAIFLVYHNTDVK